jgi:hypothetical protein
LPVTLYLKCSGKILHLKNSAPKEPTATRTADVPDYIFKFLIEKIVVFSFFETKTISN